MEKRTEGDHRLEGTTQPSKTSSRKRVWTFDARKKINEKKGLMRDAQFNKLWSTAITYVRHARESFMCSTSNTNCRFFLDAT